MNRRSGLALSILVALLPATAWADAWCRLDDPAWSEKERVKRNLGASEMSSLSCPPVPDGHKIPAQLILPMPCGRKMVMQRVDVPVAHILDHKHAYLGVATQGQDTLRAITEGPRAEDISGGFTVKEGAGKLERAYYIGKYEVLAPQYQLYADGLLKPDGGRQSDKDPACQAATEAATATRGNRVLPAVNMSWYDAVGFTQAYTEWLMAVDAERLKAGKPPLVPWEYGAAGFLRLPSEAEWEYAARGGDVDQSVQSVPTYAIVDDNGTRRQGTLDEIAAVKSPQQPPPEGSDVMYAGRHAANLFGIHDMVGNAEEMTLELFRSVRPDKLHGQVGGFVVKGGHAGDSAADLGVAKRREMPFFRNGAAARTSVMGFRVVLSVPVLMNARDGAYNIRQGNQDLLKDIEKSREQVMSSVSAAGQQQKQLIEQLSKLQTDAESRKLNEKEMNDRLAALKVELERNAATLNERDRRILRERITSAVLMVSAIDNVRRRVISLKEMLAKFERQLASNALAPADAQLVRAELPNIRNGITSLERTNQANFRYYTEQILELGGVDSAAISMAHSSAKDDFARRQIPEFEKSFDVARKHLEEVSKSRNGVPQARIDAWFNETDLRQYR